MGSSLKLRCPHCGQEFEFTATDVITPEDTQSLQALLKGRLNCAVCPSCEQVLNVPVRMIYRDSSHPYLLIHELHRPADDTALTELIQRIDAEGATAAQYHGTVRPALRLVFSRPDFIEKLCLHERGMDDRLMEYAKYQLFTGGTDGQLSPQKHRLLYDFSQSNDQRMVFIVFNRLTGKPLRLLQVPFDEYRNLHEEFQHNHQLQHELEHLFPGCMVDVDFIFQRFNREKAAQS